MYLMRTDMNAPQIPFHMPAPSGDGGGDASAMLNMLQFADSFFPSGATSFSWGLESLKLDGKVAGAEQVFELLSSHVEQRWAGFDRPLMQAARDAWSQRGAAALGEAMELDRLCEAMNLARGWRDASRRLGFTQLRVHADLGLGIAQVYLDQVRASGLPGHLPVVQGLLWGAYGLSPAGCDAMVASGLCTTVVGAALRMGLIGHTDGQRLIARARPLIARVIASPVPSLDELWTGAPALDVAAMRHEPRRARLFAN
jgi:urease accessory protein